MLEHSRAVWVKMKKRGLNNENPSFEQSCHRAWIGREPESGSAEALQWPWWTFDPCHGSSFGLKIKAHGSYGLPYHALQSNKSTSLWGSTAAEHCLALYTIIKQVVLHFIHKMSHTSLEEFTTERASKVTRGDASLLKHWGGETARLLDSRRQLNLWDHFIQHSKGG